MFDSMFGIMVVVGTVLSLNLYKFEFSGSATDFCRKILCEVPPLCA
jgi:hypothetical protein